MSPPVQFPMSPDTHCPAKPALAQRLHGRWTHHPHHGRQLQVERVLVDDPRTLEGLARYLGSGAVKGLGPAFARRVVDAPGAEEIERAVLDAARAAGLAVAEYTAGAVYRGSGGIHRFLVEPTGPAPQGAEMRMAVAIDAALHRGNANYARRRDARLIGPPEVVLVAPGAFLGWMAAQGKLGGQNKIPRVIADADRFAAAAAALTAQPPPQPAGATCRGG